MAMRISGPKTAKAAVIFLHGLGDSGAGWSFLANECHSRQSLQHVDFVLPDAPVRYFPVFRDSAPGWFDMTGFGGSIKEAVKDEEGIFQTLKNVHQLIKKEIDNGIPADKIVVGGFSQGAAITEALACTCKEFKLGGFIALSGFLPIESSLQNNAVSTNNATPMFLGHGTIDDVVPLAAGQEAFNALKTKFGMQDVVMKTYEGTAHSASIKEFEDVKDFLEKIV